MRPEFFTNQYGLIVVPWLPICHKQPLLCPYCGVPLAYVRTDGDPHNSSEMMTLGRSF